MAQTLKSIRKLSLREQMEAVARSKRCFDFGSIAQWQLDNGILYQCSNTARYEEPVLITAQKSLSGF